MNGKMMDDMNENMVENKMEMVDEIWCGENGWANLASYLVTTARLGTHKNGRVNIFRKLGWWCLDVVYDPIRSLRSIPPGKPAAVLPSPACCPEGHKMPLQHLGCHELLGILPKKMHYWLVHSVMKNVPVHQPFVNTMEIKKCLKPPTNTCLRIIVGFNLLLLTTSC